MSNKFLSRIRLISEINSGGKIFHFSFSLVFLWMLTATVNNSFAAKPAEANKNTAETQVLSQPRTGESSLTIDYASLFNGKDLTGWGYRTGNQEEIIFESFDGKIASSDNRFKVIDGILTVNPNPDEAKGQRYIGLWTKIDYPENFSFTVEFRAAINADSGIYFRGIQLQCRDYPVAGPYRNLKNYKAQDWNKIEVVVKDNVAHCTCNGEILEEALQLPATGPIGLEADRGTMEYRNILIKELK
ncbi:MAG: DUF1080 domain-containing protein [Prolixibacteraceae bacterium]